MKRRILLFGEYFYPDLTGVGKYTGEMIKWLAEQGHSCTVVTTFPFYPYWKVQPPYEKRSFWFKSERLSLSNGRFVKVIRCPHFVPKKPSGLTRLISDFTFMFNANLVLLLLLFRKKFDYTITIAPPFALGLSGLFYKLTRGGKFLYHIQDLQIDAARDLEMIKSKGIFDIFFAIERFIIKHADWVSTISTGMIEKVKSKCKKEVLFFPNWVDTSAFYPLPNRGELKRGYGFAPTDKVVLYSGAIGQKQGLETIVDAAKVLETSPNIKFAICGSGPYMQQLVEMKNEINLNNMFFFPLQPSEKFNSFINMADLHLVLQRAGASDLVLPSKLITILAVGGVAIVTAHHGTSLYNIMNTSDMGILIEPENPVALIDAINNISDEEIRKKGENARVYAEETLGSKQILSGFFSSIFNSD